MNSDEELCDALDRVEASINLTNDSKVIEPLDVNSDEELCNAADRVEASINLANDRKVIEPMNVNSDEELCDVLDRVEAAMNPTNNINVIAGEARKKCLKKRLISTKVVSTNSSKRDVQSMVQILKENPYPVQTRVQGVTNLHRDVMDLINKKLSIPEIENRLSLSRSTVTGFVCTLLQNGYPIAKKDLERLFGIFENVFQSIWTKLPQNIFERNVVRSTKSELPGVSCDQIRLVLCYRYPREYLNQMGLNFYDPDGIPFSDTQIIPTTIPNMQYRMSSFINRFLGGCNSSVGMEHSDQSSDEGNENPYYDEISDDDEDDNDSQEFTQENLSDNNDDVVLGWDDLVR